MFLQLRYCVSVSGIFFQTDQNEILCLVADFNSLGKFYLILNDFYEVSFSIYVERKTAEQKLVC